MRLFRQPLAKRADRVFDQSLYFGDATGTPVLTSRVRVVVGSNFFWLVPPFGTGEATSIPLSWIVSAEPVGHGLRIGWLNQIAKRPEVIMLGVRGILFYQPKRRDRLAQLLIAGSKSAVIPNTDAATACEECGQKPVEYYALQRIAAFGDVATAVVEPRALCGVHGPKAIRATILRNALLGTIGLMGIRALRHASELTEFAESKGVMSDEEGSRLRLASYLIPLCMLAILAAAIAFANLKM